MKHLLEFDSLYLEFGTQKVLHDIYMSCRTGEIIGLLGRNGSGKSCLMKIVFGSMKAYTQSVRIDGRYVFPHDLGKRWISYLPQEQMLPSSVTPLKALQIFGLDAKGFLTYFPGLEASLDLKAGQLAGGDRRLVEAYCILRGPGLFCILDEPFSFLSPVRNEQLIALLRETSHEKGIIVTDHAYRYVLEVCSRSYVLANGKTWPVKEERDLLKYLGGS